MPPKIENSNVMKKILNEFNNSKRCSKDVVQDVEITKRVIDAIHTSSKNEEEIIIKGLIQEIRLVKFGYLMYTEKQVKFFFLIVSTTSDKFRSEKTLN